MRNVEINGTPFRNVEWSKLQILLLWFNPSQQFCTYYLLLGFSCLNLFQAQKIRNKTVEIKSFILGASTKQQIYLGVKPIVESNIAYLLEFDQYSSDYVDPVQNKVCPSAITSPWVWRWKKTKQETLFKKRLFIVILVKLISEGTGQIFGRGHHYTTE